VIIQLSQLNYDWLSKWYDLMDGSSKRKAQAVGLEKLDVKEGDCALEFSFGASAAFLNLV
jgi:hypothetical protein